jgi:spore germination protein GerM
MKAVITAILLASLIFMVSACSLPGISTAAGTQNEGTPQVNNLQEGSESINEGGSGEDPISAEVLPDKAAAKVKLVKVTLFFATEDNSALKEEEREIQVTDGAILKACIQALQEGPETEGLCKTIPEGTVLRGISIKDKVATVDLSKEFEQENNIAGSVSRLSIVDTLTKINGVEKVRFHVEGEDMTDPGGQLLGDMSPVVLNEDGNPASGNQ